MIGSAVYMLNCYLYMLIMAHNYTPNMDPTELNKHYIISLSGPDYAQVCVPWIMFSAAVCSPSN